MKSLPAATRLYLKLARAPVQVSPTSCRFAFPSTFLSRTKGFPFVARNMSASAPKSLSSSKEWLVLLPDNADQLSQRLKVRQDHLSNIQPSVASGKVLVGGATLTKHPEEGETPQMTGSVLLVTAETEEEVRKLVAGDIYTTSGVWDPNAFTIRPFKTAIKHGVQVGQKPWG